MGKFKKSLICTLMGVLGLVLIPLFNVVDCSSNPVLTMSGVTGGEKAKISSVVNEINTLIIEDKDNTGITQTNIVTMTDVTEGGSDNGRTINITFNTTIYNELEQLQKQTIMEHILVTVENSNMSQISRSKIYNFISNNDKATSSLVRQLSEDVTADFASAYSSFKPFSGVVGWILGILTLAIFVLLGISISVDMAYIVIPLVQNFLSSSNANVKAKFVSVEAWQAVQEAEKSVGSDFKEPMTIYLKSKTKQFLAIGICLLYLVSGEIYDAIANIIDYFQGLLG